MRTPAAAPPAHPRAAALLASPWFLAAVALLLLNDHVLKAAYANQLTGKLSDFAGLFAFALFWTAILPRHRPAVFALTAAAFVLWKSPLAEPALAAWNALGLLPLARVVDYTDWIALLALVPAHHVARRCADGHPEPLRLRRTAAVAGAAGAVLAFTATSIAPRFYSIGDRPPYAIDGTRAEIAEGLRALSLLAPGDRASHGEAADTIPVLVRRPPERRVHLWLQVAEPAPGASRIRVVGARAEGPMPSTDALHEAFAAQILAPLREWLEARGGAR